MAEKKLNLLSDFPAISTQEWMDKITTDLKGADFSRKLVWRTNEGFNVNPFYRSEDISELATKDSAPGEFPYVRGTKTNNEWLIRQEIKVKDAKEANAKALDIMNKGITALGFKLNAKELSAEYVAQLLDGILAEYVELNFQLCVAKTPIFLGMLKDYFVAKGYDLNKVSGSVNCDPINRMLLKGKKITEEAATNFALKAVEAAQEMPNFRVIGVNAVSLNNAGAYVAQELGYALAWGNQYMTMLTENGVDADTAASAIKFNFGIGGNYFMEIAKFRAARWLWALIADAYAPKCKCSAKIKMHAETSTFNKTIFDAHVNLLRTQTEVMSASVAGVDSITTNTFDVTYQNSDDFSERIARNQQLLLKEESHFDKVVDPAAGSYYLETLTNEIAEQAWKLFLEIENAGGFFAAVDNGTIQQAIQTTSDKRQAAVAARKEIYLGTNQFPNFNEFAAEKVENGSGACGGCCSTPSEGVKLPTARAAEQFETLRLQTEAAAKRPKAFMLTIGNLAMRLARAQFSCNFFACAGYEVIDNLGFNTVAEGIAAAQAANADIIVLCSSDDEYATFAPEAFNTINGKQLFVVAGAPACADELKAVGIEHFVNVRTNVLETLKSFNAQLI